MRRRQFLNNTAVWSGGILVAGSLLQPLSSHTSFKLGPAYAQFSTQEQQFLQTIGQEAQANLVGESNARQVVEKMLRPVGKVTHDPRTESLSYRNAASQYVIIQNKEGRYRIRFRDELSA